MYRVICTIVTVVMFGSACAAEKSHALITGAPLHGDDWATSRPAVEVATKMQAPVQIESAVGKNGAIIKLHFFTSATDVAVQIYGTDGLHTSPENIVVEEAAVAANAGKELRVAFADGQEIGQLVVLVRGVFNGMPQTRINSFRAGAPPTRTLAAPVDEKLPPHYSVLPAQRRNH